LTSRQGPSAPGADKVRAELTALGAEVTVAACDVGDADAVAALLAAVPEAHPLTAVVHTAGVLDDTVLTSLTAAQLGAVLRPKADGAWHLHRATEHLDLSAFVLFSSAVGLLGNPGQANYAAANTYLDALAQHRRARGLTAVSLAWGHWAEAGGMAAGLNATEAGRLARTGLAPMPTEDALQLFDSAFDSPYANVVTAALDTAEADPDALSPLLGGLVRKRRRAARTTAGDGPATLLAQLAGKPEAEQHRRLLALVRATAAAVLGHPDADAVRPDIGFMEGEFDSLGVIELRNRLNTATGLRLPTTAVFDHPTPTALAAYLRELLAPAPASPEPTATASVPDLAGQLDQLERAVSSLTGDEDTRVHTVTRLASLLEALRGVSGVPADGAGVADQITRASNDEIFDFIDNELGIS
jgi:acyl carrier protein